MWSVSCGPVYTQNREGTRINRTDAFSRTVCSVWLAGTARSVNYWCWGVSVYVNGWFLQCSPCSSHLLCVLHENPTLCYRVWFCLFICCTQTLILGLPVLYWCSYEWWSGSDLASENVSLDLEMSLTMPWKSGFAYLPPRESPVWFLWSSAVSLWLVTGDGALNICPEK